MKAESNYMTMQNHFIAHKMTRQLFNTKTIIYNDIG